MIRRRLPVPWAAVAVALAVSCQPVRSADEKPDPRRQLASLVAERGGRMVVSKRADGEPSVALELAGTQVSDSDLVRLVGVPGLTRLDLRASLITDAGLKHLASLKTLEALDLSRTRVSDRGLDALVVMNPAT